MKRKAQIGEIWLIAKPTIFLKEDNNSYDTGFQIRPFLIVDDGKGLLVIENKDYLGLKITTKKNKMKIVEEISNWKELGLKEKSYIRIEIPERIEEMQLIKKIADIPNEQFIKYYSKMISIFNIDIANEIIEKMTQKN